MKIAHIEPASAADTAAIALGFTRRLYIEGGMQGGEFLVQPDADLDGKFRAWGLDWQEWTSVLGWACDIEEYDA